MPTFAYTARDRQGVGQTGVVEARNEEEALSSLQHRGLFITSISASDAGQGTGDGGARPSSSRRFHRGVTTDDQVLFCQQLGTLIEAGVPLLRSLQVVSMQVESRRLLTACEEVIRAVAAGQTFRDALAKHPAIFSDLWLNLVETGEASGHLASSLTHLARHFELVRHLHNEAKTALTYPAFLIVMAIIVLSLFVYWLIPKFSVMFANIEGMELPAITQFVIGVSHVARRHAVLTIGVAIAASALLRRYLRTPAGQWMRDRALLSVPLFKGVFQAIYLAEFSRGLATLLHSGVPLLSALEILERSATSHTYRKAISVIRQAVREGKPMAGPMEATGCFPPMASQMVRVGEEVGELAKMVERTAHYYEERVETAIARMTRLFEPVAIVVMGGLVLVIVLAIFLPIFKISRLGG